MGSLFWRIGRHRGARTPGTHRSRSAARRSPARPLRILHAGLENKVEEFATLPANWNQDENATRRIGGRWRRQGSFCLLTVPSAILPEESNFVLNPEHPDAKRLRLVRERPFTFHPRLI